MGKNKTVDQMKVAIVQQQAQIEDISQIADDRKRSLIYLRSAITRLLSDVLIEDHRLCVAVSVDESNRVGLTFASKDKRLEFLNILIECSDEDLDEKVRKGVEPNFPNDWYDGFAAGVGQIRFSMNAHMSVPLDDIAFSIALFRQSRLSRRELSLFEEVYGSNHSKQQRR